MDTARNNAVKTGSLGLISMEERAQLAGGRLKLRTVPGGGTTVQATFALAATDKPIGSDCANDLTVGTP